jgi:transcriptional regulator with XRE-family HTH domain
MATQAKTRLPVPALDHTIGERIKYFRTQRGFSQTQLAQEAKLSQSTIAQIESGRKDPSVITLRKIAKVVDTELASLFAANDVFVFDLRRLRRKYNHRDKLTPHLYTALGKIIQYARDIKYL